jgi:hypothetical protein
MPFDGGPLRRTRRRGVRVRQRCRLRSVRPTVRHRRGDDHGVARQALRSRGHFVSSADPKPSTASGPSGARPERGAAVGVWTRKTLYRHGLDRVPEAPNQGPQKVAESSTSTIRRAAVRVIDGGRDAVRGTGRFRSPSPGSCPDRIRSNQLRELVTSVGAVLGRIHTILDQAEIGIGANGGQ